MKKRHLKSNFSKIMIISVSVLIVAMVGVLFLIFRTNAIYAFSESTIETAKELTMQVSVITESTKTESLISTDLSNTAINSSEWYTDMSSISADTSQSVQIGSLTAYKGYPWCADKETFFYNIVQAKTDLWNFYDKVNAPAPIHSERDLDYALSHFWTNEYTYRVPITKRPISGSTSAGSSYTLIDGVQCYYFCPMPAMVDQNYYSSGDWAKKSTPDADMYYEHTKFALVLAPTANDISDTSKWLYLPCVAGDAKAHTYPWGVSQTNIRVHDSSSVDVAYNNGGGEQNVTIQLGDISTDKSVETAVNDSHFGPYLGNVRDCLYCVFETCGMKSYDSSALTKSYTCIGCITYKE